MTTLNTAIDEEIRDCISRNRLVIAPAKVLSEVAVEIEYSQYVPALFTAMERTATVFNGVGFAAPQMGLSIRFIIINTDDGFVGMLNPKIIKFSKDSVGELEGCLSVPTYRFVVARHSEVEISYTDLGGNEQTRWFKGFEARCVQHEINHLDGITIIESSNLNRSRRKGVEKVLQKIKRKMK